MQTSKKLVLGSVLALSAGVALASTATNTADFAAISTLLLNWATGSLGKVIALAIFVVGLAAGITKQSIMAVVVGVAGAMALTYGPNILQGMFTAVI